MIFVEDAVFAARPEGGAGVALNEFVGFPEVPAARPEIPAAPAGLAAPATELAVSATTQASTPNGRPRTIPFAPSVLGEKGSPTAAGTPGSPARARYQPAAGYPPSSAEPTTHIAKNWEPPP